MKVVGNTFFSRLLSEGGGRRGGGTLIFSYVGKLRPFLGAQNLKFQCFWRVFRKMNFLGV